MEIDMPDLPLKVFLDLPNGDTIELLNGGEYWDRETRETLFYFGRLPTTGELIHGNRWVRMKKNPVLHKCDAKCRRAPITRLGCQCSCGGRNHGRERIQCA